MPVLTASAQGGNDHNSVRGPARGLTRAGGTLWNPAAAVRRHPIGFLLLSAALAALVTWCAVSVTVSVRLDLPR